MSFLVNYFYINICNYYYICCPVKCIHPHNLPMIDDSLRVSLDFDPPVMDTNATFSCLPGLVLRGPYISACMENGEWEPDPKEVECLGEIYTIHVLSGQGEEGIIINVI